MIPHDVAKKLIELSLIVFICTGLYHAWIYWHWSIPLFFVLKLVFWIPAELAERKREREENEE